MGQTNIRSIVDKETEKYLDAKGTLGVSVGVVSHQKSYTSNYGIVNLTESKIPDENSIYSVGSISKTFIATFLAQAVVSKNECVPLITNPTYPFVCLAP